jgi:hypothetical protein
VYPDRNAYGNDNDQNFNEDFNKFISQAFPRRSDNGKGFSRMFDDFVFGHVYVSIFYCLQYYRAIVVSVTESDLSAQETQQNLKDISQY